MFRVTDSGCFVHYLLRSPAVSVHQWEILSGKPNGTCSVGDALGCLWASEKEERTTTTPPSGRRRPTRRSEHSRRPILDRSARAPRQGRPEAPGCCWQSCPKDSPPPASWGATGGTAVSWHFWAGLQPHPERYFFQKLRSPFCTSLQVHWQRVQAWKAQECCADISGSSLRATS